MDSSPITTWEGAGAYFTFADMPGVLYLILALAVIACFGTIVMAAKHETEAFEKIKGKD
ncbi:MULTISPECIES: hypothetical protein [Methyloceanibacter]|uniref:hypothetical protein n=1 Tax=Methyloceanibacter TaxID=1484898 RepID=UPI001571EB96|nr:MULTISPECIES: hypothetical protein [Methyloceanibacter]